MEIVWLMGVRMVQGQQKFWVDAEKRLETKKV